MKKHITKRLLIIIVLLIQILQLLGNFSYTKANIKEGDKILLQGDHECDSLLEYWMEDYQKWSYKIVWYVYYLDNEDGNKYPAFCVQPQKNGVGTGYDSYQATIKEEKDNRIWRILNKGYMGSNYKEWNLECDDDFYSATKIALHGLAENIAPKDKYILGDRSVDGNSIEEIKRRGEKVLRVAQLLYEYGLTGTDKYVSPKVDIKQDGQEKIEKIGNVLYYIQNYEIRANKTLKSYEIEIQDFTKGTKILNTNNQEVSNLKERFFKIAIPTSEIKQNINGIINIKNACIKTNPIFYCDSGIEEAQNYVTYTNGYEKTSTSTMLNIKANKCNLVIKKIDKENKNPIPNVTFEIKDENENKITEVTTNKEGIAYINNLNSQIITIKETKVPEPYILSDEKKQVLLEYGKTLDICFENEIKKGNLKIIKVDSDTKVPLENVEFNLINIKGEKIKTLITNKKGEAYAENLQIGKYYLKEIKTNIGYEVCSDKEVNVEWNKTVEAKIENQKQKGQIEIYKMDNEDKNIKLERIIFEILDENKKRIETIITDEKGYAITNKLPIGKYYVREIETNDKYILNKELVEIEVKDKQRVTLNITNQKIKGRIKIIKLSEDDNLINGVLKENPIKNVVFEIRKEDGQLVENLTTNEKGIAISKKLEKGKYIVKEVKTDKDYEINQKEFLIEIIKDNQLEEVTIYNKSKKIDPPKLPRTGF